MLTIEKMSSFETLELNNKNLKIFDKWTKIIWKFINICVMVGKSKFYLFGILFFLFWVINDPCLARIISSIIWLPSHLLLLVRTSGAQMLFTFYYVFFVSLYLKLRFRQIYQDLKYFKKISEIIFFNYTQN